jgi:hypothetical protein
VIAVNIVDGNSNCAAWGCVPMMLGEMDDAGAPRDLRIKRHARFEPMFPVEREPQEAKVEIFGLPLVEYP